MVHHHVHSAAILLLALLASSPLEAFPRYPNRWPTRIIGGDPAEDGQFPYQVSVRFGGSHVCGGSILSELTILTAGHCIFASASSYSVLAGTLSLEASPGDPYQLKTVDSYQRHKDYNAETLENDLALLFLEVTDPLVFDAAVGKISFGSDLDVTGNATVSGWGVTAEGGSLSSKLMAVEMFIIDATECAETYGIQLKDSMICAGIPEEGGKDSCQGDSGGPLVIETEGGTYKYEQIGIVSWGTGCARPGFPGVYTKVAYFNAWIQMHMKTIS